MLTEFIARAAPVAVICAGALMVMRHSATFGTIVAFYTLFGSLSLPLQRFSELSTIVASSVAGIERIFTFFDEQPEVADRPGAAALRISRGEVVFDHVSFAYRASDGSSPRTVLDDLNLRVEPGTTV